VRRHGGANNPRRALQQIPGPHGADRRETSKEIAMRIRRGLSCLACCTFALPLPALAADDVPPEALNVKVYADRYMAAGKQFSDLASLESWAKPIPLRAMWLDNCNPASVRQLLAAVERFQGAFAEGIVIRPAGGCATEGAPATTHAEYLATDDTGRGWMP
jgi:hypothetical protein